MESKDRWITSSGIVAAVATRDSSEAQNFEDLEASLRPSVGSLR